MGTYAYLCVVFVVFLVTDLLRYKPVIVVNGVTGIATWSILAWGRTVPLMQVRAPSGPRRPEARANACACLALRPWSSVTGCSSRARSPTTRTSTPRWTAAATSRSPATHARSTCWEGSPRPPSASCSSPPASWTTTNSTSSLWAVSVSASQPRYLPPWAELTSVLLSSDGAGDAVGHVPPVDAAQRLLPPRSGRRPRRRHRLEAAEGLRVAVARLQGRVLQHLRAQVVALVGRRHLRLRHGQSRLLNPFSKRAVLLQVNLSKKTFSTQSRSSARRFAQIELKSPALNSTQTRHHFPVVLQASFCFLKTSIPQPQNAIFFSGSRKCS